MTYAVVLLEPCDDCGEVHPRAIGPLMFDETALRLALEYAEDGTPAYAVVLEAP